MSDVQYSDDGAYFWDEPSQEWKPVEAAEGGATSGAAGEAGADGADGAAADGHENANELFAQSMESAQTEATEMPA